jgi:hypothetical protein
MNIQLSVLLAWSAVFTLFGCANNGSSSDADVDESAALRIATEEAYRLNLDMSQTGEPVVELADNIYVVTWGWKERNLVPGSYVYQLLITKSNGQVLSRRVGV